MKPLDLNDESAWATANAGAEYTASVPFAHPRLPHGVLSVLMVCDGTAFTAEDREHAQQRIAGLPQRLDGIFTRIIEHLGVTEEHAARATQGTPTLMLHAGNHSRWIFAMDDVSLASSVFVEWYHDQIVGVWISV